MLVGISGDFTVQPYAQSKVSDGKLQTYSDGFQVSQNMDPPPTHLRAACAPSQLKKVSPV